MHNFDPSTLDPATADGALNYNVYSLWSPILHPQICGFLPCPLQLTNCLCSSKPLRTAREGGSILMWCLVETEAWYDWAIIDGEWYESSHCSRFKNGDFSVLRRELRVLPLLFLIAFAFTSEKFFSYRAKTPQEQDVTQRSLSIHLCSWIRWFCLLTQVCKQTWTVDFLKTHHPGVPFRRGPFSGCWGDADRGMAHSWQVHKFQG